MSEITLHLGDCLEVMRGMADSSVDAVVTDPPYPREYIPLYEELAREGARLLRDGGVLATMAGQSYLPELMARMSQHLDYHWTIAYLTGGGPNGRPLATQIWPRKVITFWKPVLVFAKGKRAGKWFGDVSKSPANDKQHHKWGQSEGGMIDLLERLTMPEQVVLDPFMGSGTTGVACVNTARNFIGIEKDAGYYAIAEKRIQDAQNAARQMEFAS